MAVLESGSLGLEIRFIELDSNNWIQYEILFLYNGEPMVQDHQLKRYNEHWARRSPGAFKANQYGHDGFIPTIRAALDTDEVRSFTPIDPDITFVVYPRRVFPYLTHPITPIEEEDPVTQEEEDRALIRELAGGRLPDDPFTIICKIDLYNYGRQGVYQGQGPALIVLAHRHEVRAFLEALEREYAAFCEQWGIEDPPNRL